MRAIALVSHLSKEELYERIQSQKEAEARSQVAQASESNAMQRVTPIG
jgi:hypothetical protein